ncbi:CHAT domain-containing protein [Microbacterium sp. cf046]|uniref:CHAT domain-containing protein n=1 Tax=Microbacterium sp. cf046 TaxID=1761803 RepID=UPI0008ECD9AE|nr:CHAT domain-containing protein [Microbacterium sp. cf046]SFS14288.1 CHAT domain-containing protein [Microbacterium sp. cf046]
MDTVIELEIGAGPSSGSYAVHVVRSLAGGEPSSVIELDVDAMIAGLPQLESSILASSVSARRVMTTGESAIQTIGVRLFDTVFAGKVGEAYRASAAVAAERGLVAQMTLRLTEPDLAALPWEALYDSEAGRYVSRKEPLVRRVSAPYSAEPPPVTAPLRILGMVSAPRGLPVLDVEAEKERLESALEQHLAEGRVELDWLDDVTWGGIHSRLLREPWHVLHFIGHGGYDVQADEGLVALVGRDGRADFVAASSLADLLMEAGSAPRLVVLNSCQSGATGSSDLFAGTAATLVRSGIHAVVAMQFAVTDYAALAFARSFYVALASGRRIGEAVRSGRIGILGTARDTLEWITPVLYLRGEDARLLEMIEPAHRVPVPVVAPLTDPEPLPDPPAEPEPAVQTEPELPGPDAPSRSAIGTPAESGAAATAVVPGPPSQIEDLVAEEAGAPPPRGRRRRWPVVAGIVTAVVLVGGVVWAAAALWGGLFVTDTAASSSPTPTPTPTPTPVPTVHPAVQLAIPAAADWTDTGLSCGQGDLLAITATGTILHEDNPNSTVPPEGILTAEGLPEPYFQQWNVPGLPDAATASLIGSLDKAEPFFVGPNLTYTCPRVGEFFLGINDIGLEGNSGAWDVTIVKTDNPPLD